MMKNTKAIQLIAEAKADDLVSIRIEELLGLDAEARQSKRLEWMKARCNSMELYWIDRISKRLSLDESYAALSDEEMKHQRNAGSRDGYLSSFADEDEYPA